ncbi:MAG: ChaB family protein [Plectolyngbya sp. WJT66-NPBG17]|jgi:cation transport regulator ChaB|nr:ChaB family protein [Plectolyngbya sp. WJT66-NPBG17]
MPTGNEQTQANPQIAAEDKKFEAVNSIQTSEEQANLATPKSSADKLAAKRDDVDEKNEKLPAEVTDQLLDGSDQVFMTAFKNSQSDGLSHETALKVAWSSVEQGFQRSQDGSWHRKTKPDDNVLSSGVGGSSS